MKDRAEFYAGPARRDVEKVAERVQDVVDTKPTTAGTASFEVTGSYTVVGLPPGIPYVYVNSLLTQSPLSTTNAFGYTGSFPDSNDNARALRYVTQDITNAFDRGTAAMVGRDGTGIVVFNPAAGTIGRTPLLAGMSMTALYGANPWQSNRMILDYRVGSSAFYVENGSIVQLPLEPAGDQLFGVGPAADGVNICSVWTTAGGTHYLAIHDPSGVRLGVRSLGLLFSGVDHKVQNGYVMTWKSSANTYIVTPASLTGQVFSSNFNLNAIYSFRSNITPDGYVFWESSTDLYRLNCATGLLEVFPDAFTFDPSLGFTRITPVSMSARNANELGYVGYISLGNNQYVWAWVPVVIGSSVVTSSPVVSSTVYASSAAVGAALGATGPCLVRANGGATFQAGGSPVSGPFEMNLYTVAFP